MIKFTAGLLTALAIGVFLLYHAVTLQQFASKELYKSLHHSLVTKADGVRQEARVGARTAQEVVNSAREAMCALEFKMISELRNKPTTFSFDSIIYFFSVPSLEKPTRLQVIDQAIKTLALEITQIREMVSVGAQTRTDVATAEAALLKARIYRDVLAKSSAMWLPKPCGDIYIID